MANCKITVSHFEDDIYQVVREYEPEYMGEESYLSDILFQGSISDCEAYIRLKDGGNMRICLATAWLLWAYFLYYKGKGDTPMFAACLVCSSVWAAS